MVSCWLVDLLLANRRQRNDFIQDLWSRTPPNMSSQTICKAKRDGAVDGSVALSFQAVTERVEDGLQLKVRAGHSVREGSQVSETLCCPPGDVRERKDFWTDPKRSEPKSIRFRVGSVSSSADRSVSPHKVWYFWQRQVLQCCALTCCQSQK